MGDIGRQYWRYWESLECDPDAPLIYFTDDWDPIDVEELVKVLRQDGVAASLPNAHEIIQSATIEHGYYGIVAGDVVTERCSEDGETSSGEAVEAPVAATFVCLN